MVCSKCGKDVANGTIFCDNCGNRLYNEQEQPIHNTINTYPQAVTKPKLNIMALVGFILGCVSFLINFWGIVGMVALVFSIVGFTQIKNNGGRGKGFAIAGMILGAIGVVYGFVVLIALSSL